MTQDMKTILSSEMSPDWFWLPHQPSPLELDLKSFVLLPGTPLPPNPASLSDPLTLGSCSLGINTPHHCSHPDSPITLCHSLPGWFLLPCPSWFSRIKQIPQVPSSSSPAVPCPPAYLVLQAGLGTTPCLDDSSTLGSSSLSHVVLSLLACLGTCPCMHPL